MAITQAQRAVTVSCTQLDTDKLLLRRMETHEELGRLFAFELEFAAEDFSIDPATVLGQSLAVKVLLPAGGERYFHGIVARFGQTSGDGRLATYRATLRPWLWLLTHCSDCRIFQEKTVPDIIKEVFEGHGLADFEDKLAGSYATREYCVQYCESDFDFVSRLMEKEGIYYYFRHEAGRHVMVLADDYSGHKSADGYAEVPYFPPDAHNRRKRDHLWEWSQALEVQSTKLTLNDYDFTRPSAALLSNSTATPPASSLQFARYGYPGAYIDTGAGDHYARTSLEALRTRATEVVFRGDARGLGCGGLFTLSGCPREPLNIEYLITALNCSLQLDDFHSGGGGAGFDFGVSLRTQDAQAPFRALPLTPVGRIAGPQTAVVVGPSGAEIHTDQHGRVKVHFHWDRHDQRDENSSCWIRVSQAWAGKGWGGMLIPRIGQEVIVDFLEGDPDQPIIVGRVYNGEQTVPFGLPDNATQSGIRSRSSTGGAAANCNEIRLEDKAGSEHLLIHAEKDQMIEVEHDETHWVGNDRKKNVDHDETVTIGNDRTESVGNNESISIKAKQKLDVGTERSTKVGTNDKLDVGQKLTITAGTEISLTTGAASIVLKSDGTIEISGVQLKISASATLKASASASAEVDGGGMLTLKGGMVKIN